MTDRKHWQVGDGHGRLVVALDDAGCIVLADTHSGVVHTITDLNRLRRDLSVAEVYGNAVALGEETLVRDLAPLDLPEGATP